MATSNQPIYPQAINSPVTALNTASGSTLQTIFTAGANGSKVESIIVTSTDASNRTLQLYLNNGSTSFLIGTILVEAGVGNLTNIPTLEFLKTTVGQSLANGTYSVFNNDAYGNFYIYVPAGFTLKAAVTTTISSGKQVSLLVQGGDF